MAHTKNGTRPAATSSSMHRPAGGPGASPGWPGRPAPAAAARAAGRRPGRPSPPTSAPRPRCRRPGRRGGPRPPARSRAASRAQRLAPDAPSWIDAAAGTGRPEPLGEPEQLGQPVEDERLHLGAGRAGRPEHPLDAEAGGHEVADHRRAGRVAVEVGVEVRATASGWCRAPPPGRGRPGSPTTPRGAPAGTAASAARTSPGSTWARTGRSSTRSMYRATHSTASWAWRRNSSGLIR